MKSSLIVLLLVLCWYMPARAQSAAEGWIPLFNGEDLTGLYTFRPADGKNNDPQGVFKVHDGMIHILDVADPTKPQENGYVATNNEYRNYHLRLEYKWGVKQMPVPRHETENLPRDSGILYHIYGNDKRWPQSVEFQIQEHDTGDVWLLWDNPRPTVRVQAATTRPAANIYKFEEGGELVLQNQQRIVKSAEHDSLTDWNVLDLYVTEDSAVHVVNGHVVNAVRDIRVGRSEVPLVQGKIALQAESNEVMYRNVQIRPLLARGGGPEYKVLVFSKTAGFRHDSIPDGIAAIKLLGQQNGFGVDATEDSGAFTDQNLAQYRAIVFLSSSGDVLNDAQQAALQKYIRGGGGFVGIHAASTTEYDWPWFGQLVGAYFLDHPEGTPSGMVKLEDKDHPSTSSLPLTWTRNDEWYNFRSNPRANVNVLISADESSFQGGKMGQDHPIAWYHEFDGGRSWYTGLGHTKESYSDPLFLMHILGGIEYAAGRSRVAPSDATVLFDGKDASKWEHLDGRAVEWPVQNGVIESKYRSGDIYTKEKFDSFTLHAEFKIPAVKASQTRNAITNEQSKGNSGVYLQGRYEAQILDSFDHPLQDKNDIGAIYEVKDADVNAALPPEMWQTYDIHFTAPKWEGERKVANARATYYLNGMRVQNDVEIPNMTRSGRPEAPGPGPIMLQDHLNPVQFRNIWIRPVK